MSILRKIYRDRYKSDAKSLKEIVDNRKMYPNECKELAGLYAIFYLSTKLLPFGTQYSGLHYVEWSDFINAIDYHTMSENKELSDKIDDIIEKCAADIKLLLNEVQK